MHLGICSAKKASYNFSYLFRKSLIFLSLLLVFDAFSKLFACKITYICFWFASFQGFILWTRFCLFFVRVLIGKKNFYLTLKHGLNPWENVSDSKACLDPLENVSFSRIIVIVIRDISYLCFCKSKTCLWYPENKP